MDRRIWHALTALSFATALGCTGEGADARFGDTAEAAASEAPAPRETNVRLVNAMPGATSVDLVAGIEPEVTSVAFRAVSPYEPISSDIESFRVVRAGQSGGDTTALATRSGTSLDGQYYTLVAVGGGGSTESARRDTAARDDTAADTAGARQPGGTTGLSVPGDRERRGDIVVLRDDEPLSDSTKARLRVVNAATNRDGLDITVAGTDDPIFEGVESGAGVKSAEVHSGTATIQVRDDDRTVARLTDVQLEPGRTVTLILTHPSPTSERVEIIRISDTAPEASRPAGADTTR